MATEIKSKTINSGDPVTFDVINNLILDLQTLSQAAAPSFKLVLGDLTKKPDGAAVSQKIYSTIITKKINVNSKTGGTWNFAASDIKFNNIPRCWVQLANKDTSTPPEAFNFKIVITSVSTTSMTFQVRGKSFSEATHDFICFAADA